MARILVAEDEPGIALGLKNELTVEGYEVEQARDGQAAWERASAGGFDLILLDVMMPRKDGSRSAANCGKPAIERRSSC